MCIYIHTPTPVHRYIIYTCIWWYIYLQIQKHPDSMGSRAVVGHQRLVTALFLAPSAVVML